MTPVTPWHSLAIDGVMPSFRRLLIAAVIAGAAAGLVISAIQAAVLWPMIDVAEVFEAAAQPGPHHTDGADEWMPEGILRPILTVLFNVGAGIGFGLIMNALISIYSLLNGEARRRLTGFHWGVAGFVVFSLAPSLGLPPELPGVLGGDLVHRQLWWLLTVLCTAAAIAVWVFQGGYWRITSVLLALLPHIAGAPPSHELGVMPGGRAAAFATASLVASAVFWMVLGGVSDWARRRWGQVTGPA